MSGNASQKSHIRHDLPSAVYHVWAEEEVIIFRY